MSKNLKNKLDLYSEDIGSKRNKKLIFSNNKIKPKKTKNKFNEFDMTELEIESRKIHYGINRN